MLRQQIDPHQHGLLKPKDLSGSSGRLRLLWTRGRRSASILPDLASRGSGWEQMGSTCCHAESPCGSVEETSVLLKDDSKAALPAEENDFVGTCVSDRKDDIRKTPHETSLKVEVKDEDVKVKQSADVGETEPNNTQENGPSLDVVIKTTMPSPKKESEVKENPTRAQDGETKDLPTDGGQAEPPQCTLNSLPKVNATAGWEAITATSAAPQGAAASAQDKIPDVVSQEAGAENHSERNATAEPTAPATTQDKEVDNAAAEPAVDFSLKDEVLSAPNTRLSGTVCQPPVSSAVSEQLDKESPSRTAAEDQCSSACQEASPEFIKSHEAPESSRGSEPTGLGHGGEERDSASSPREPETTAEADASESPKADQDSKPELDLEKEVASFEDVRQDISEDTTANGQDKDGDIPKAEEENHELTAEVEEAPSEARPQAGKDAESQEVAVKEEPPAGSSSTGGKTDETPVAAKEEPAEDGLESSEEDLYRGAEELSASPAPPPALETPLLKVEDRCSLAAATDILSYSEREWKGNTTKSALIRKGYKEMSQRFGSLRRVRGDNYCALRATLFQVLAHSTQLPAWLQEENVTALPKQLEAQDGLLSHWTFPGECLQGDKTADATLQLEGYMELLRNKWRAAVGCSSALERQQLCERAFRGGEEELGLFEALKLLMLGRAAELHGCMQAGEDVPLFCWLLFARDSSDCPRSFLSNHLSQVGLSAGLEQVEMFLLGYTLQCTIQVYRLYKADTEEFVTYYPDDHKDDWPSVCLVTEDDRHYNVPVVEAAERGELDSS